MFIIRVTIEIIFFRDMLLKRVIKVVSDLILMKTIRSNILFIKTTPNIGNFDAKRELVLKSFEIPFAGLVR